MTVVWNNYRSGLNGEFADAVDAALGPMADTWHATQGLRPNAEQDADYAKGRDADGNVVDESEVVTNARAGQSPHNPQADGLCEALDVARSDGVALRWDYVMNPDGSINWEKTHPAWARLKAVIEAAPILHSGMDFPGDFKDPPHIERVNWRAHE